jgi:hypothetical protein
VKAIQRQFDYGSSASADESSRAAPVVTEPSLVRHGPVTWSIRGIYLTAWAIVGIFLWVPRLIGALLLFSLSRVRSALLGRSAAEAGRHLRSAADFYRGFVRAMEAVRAPAEGEPLEAEGPPPVAPRPILPEIAWAVLVWYVVLWPAGIVEATPVDLASSIAAAPWSEMWAGAVHAIASIPELFSG